MTSREPNSGEEPQVVVRDRRRVDPLTGEVRPPAPEEAGGPPPDGELPVQDSEVVEAVEISSQEVELKAQLDERTADLQRLQADYANYRKRIERDREAVVNAAKASVAGELLSVLDDVDRAAQHGDLTGAFKTVADKLVGTLERAGLEAFGHEGEPFDPSVHEAVQHDTSPAVAGPTVTAVLRRGYRFGDRIVRAALVGVTDFEAGAAPVDEAPAEGGSGEWFDPNNPNDKTNEQI